MLSPAIGYVEIALLAAMCLTPAAIAGTLVVAVWLHVTRARQSLPAN